MSIAMMVLAPLTAIAAACSPEPVPTSSTILSGRFQGAGKRVIACATSELISVTGNSEMAELKRLKSALKISATVTRAPTIALRSGFIWLRPNENLPTIADFEHVIKAAIDG